MATTLFSLLRKTLKSVGASLLVITCGMLFSCLNKNNTVSVLPNNTLMKFDSTLSINTNKGEKPLANFINSKSYKIIVFLNGSCSSCYAEYWKWTRLYDRIKSHQNLEILFIVYGSKKDLPRIINNHRKPENFNVVNDSLSKNIAINNLDKVIKINTYILDSSNVVKQYGNFTFIENYLLNELDIN